METLLDKAQQKWHCSKWDCFLRKSFCDKKKQTSRNDGQNTTVTQMQHKSLFKIYNKSLRGSTCWKRQLVLKWELTEQVILYKKMVSNTKNLHCVVPISFFGPGVFAITRTCIYWVIKTLGSSTSRTSLRMCQKWLKLIAQGPVSQKPQTVFIHSKPLW